MIQENEFVYTSPHPLHAMLVGGAVALFLGVLLNDFAYVATYEIQWKNFASWLLVGGLVVGALTLLWAIVELFRASVRTTSMALYLALLAIAWVLGFINAFVHAGDAWASVPQAPILSALVVVLAVAAAMLGFRARSRISP